MNSDLKNHILAPAAAVAIVIGGAATAGVEIEYLGVCRATDISADGSVVVGNTSNYGTFRWTADGGLVDLGRNAYAAIGVAAGTPDVSADGTRISASILNAAGTLMTPGLWTLGEGWLDLMPPNLPDGAVLDQALGSAWGMSEDGTVVTGLYWRNTAVGGLAHPFVWTEGAGIVGLDTESGNGRGNDVSADGSMVAGWEERTDGLWRPTVWIDGVRTTLADHPEAFCEASGMTPDGTVIIGQSYDADSGQLAAAKWTWDGAQWNETLLGVLPGTFPGFGSAIANDCTDDGSVVVGFNAFDFSNFSGWIWTEATGMVDAADFLADAGVVLPPHLSIVTLTSITPDGSAMTGIADQVTFPFEQESFIIRITDDCPGDLTGDDVIDSDDLFALLGAWGPCPDCDADLTGDGDVDSDDLFELLGAWGACPSPGA